MKNELVEVIETNAIDKTNADLIQESFGGFLSQAKEWEQKSFDIIITDESQTDLMKQARESRLVLKKIRCDAENKRKLILQDSKLFTNAVNGANNIIKMLTTKSEKHLEAQEKYIENIQKERLDNLEEKRSNELEKYECDPSAFNLRIMDEEVYQKQLTIAKDYYNRLKQEEKAEEARRIEVEKKQKEENERIKKENEILKKEAEKQAKIENERKAKEEAEQKKRDAEIEKQRLAHEAELKAEREKQAKIENELKAIKDAELKAISEENARKAKEKEDDRQKLLAPDKDKLNQLAVKIVSMQMPEVKDPKAKEIINQTIELLNKTSSYIKSNAIKL